MADIIIGNMKRIASLKFASVQSQGKLKYTKLLDFWNSVPRSWHQRMRYGQLCKKVLQIKNQGIISHNVVTGYRQHCLTLSLSREQPPMVFPVPTSLLSTFTHIFLVTHIVERKTNVFVKAPNDKVSTPDTEEKGFVTEDYRSYVRLIPTPLSLHDISSPFGDKFRGAHFSFPAGPSIQIHHC